MRSVLLLVAVGVCLLALAPSCVSAHEYFNHPMPVSEELEHEVHHHHEPPSNKPPMCMNDPADSCQSCQAMVTQAYEATQNATDMSILLTDMQNACALNASTALICDIIAAAIVKELPKLPAKLHKAGYYNAAIVCSFFGQCSVPCCNTTGNAPSQIHLSNAGAGTLANTMMSVTWITADDTADVNVRWGLSDDSFTGSTTAETQTYTQGGWIGSIHLATMTGLEPGQTYYYQVGGDKSGWSQTIAFNTISSTLPANFTFAIYGDLGSEKNYSGGNQAWVNYAASDAAPEDLQIDTILHIGDISYADGYMERWDELFTTLEPAASTLPYMTVPGNHELYFNFTSYRDRLAMPTFASGAPQDGMWYSYDAGCIHFVALNSESVIDTPYISPAQVAWLKADLAAFATRRSAGRLIEQADPAACTYDAPTFLIVYMHRPLYCSAGGKEGSKRCGADSDYLQGQVEDIFQQYAVDMVFQGHVHSYQRTTNVYQGDVDPSGPIYILNGAGGNREGQDGNWADPSPAWDVTHMAVAGLGYLTMVNSTTLSWEFFQQTDLVTALANNAAPVVSDQVFVTARSS